MEEHSYKSQKESNIFHSNSNICSLNPKGRFKKEGRGMAQFPFINMLLIRKLHSYFAINFYIEFTLGRIFNLFKDIADVAGGLGSIPGPVRSDTVSPTARYCCDVSSELCCPDAKSRR